MFGRPHGGAPTDWSGGTLAAAIEMFVKLARGWWSDTLPLSKKFRVQPSFFGNPIFFIHSVSIPPSKLN